MKQALKLVVTVLALATTALVQANLSICPTNMDNLTALAKQSESDMYGKCNPYCSAGTNALPFVNKDKAAQCACYCQAKAPFFEQAGYYKNPAMAQKYRDAATTLAGYADKKGISTVVPA